MCSIYGAFGRNIDREVMAKLAENAKDRGRDGGRLEWFDLGYREAALGNWRATPTTELEAGRLQPYDGVVHNGTIANDEELGRLPGEIDSEVLPRILDRSGLMEFRRSLLPVVGSYALAAVADRTVYLANNYKPLHWWGYEDGPVYFSSMASHFEGICPPYQAPVQMPPYSVVDMRHLNQVCPLPRRRDRSVVVIASGGLDSTTVAAYYRDKGCRVAMLHFRYGCHAGEREEQRVPMIAKELGCEYAILDVPRGAVDNSALHRGGDIAAGVAGAEYAHEWVPCRNLVLLSLAAAWAEGHGFHTLALGNNLEESGAYPDNEPQMFHLLDNVLNYAVQNGYDLRIEQPVGHLMKHEIVALGLKLGAPLGLTWSCYRGGVLHCGNCGPCFMRREAFARNGVDDPVFKGAA